MADRLPSIYEANLVDIQSYSNPNNEQVKQNKLDVLNKIVDFMDTVYDKADSVQGNIEEFIDADTLKIRFGDGTVENVRLNGELWGLLYDEADKLATITGNKNKQRTQISLYENLFGKPYNQITKQDEANLQKYLAGKVYNQYSPRSSIENLGISLVGRATGELNSFQTPLSEYDKPFNPNINYDFDTNLFKNMPVNVSIKGQDVYGRILGTVYNTNDNTKNTNRLAIDPETNADYNRISVGSMMKNLNTIGMQDEIDSMSQLEFTPRQKLYLTEYIGEVGKNTLASLERAFFGIYSATRGNKYTSWMADLWDALDTQDMRYNNTTFQYLYKNKENAEALIKMNHGVSPDYIRITEQQNKQIVDDFKKGNYLDAAVRASLNIFDFLSDSFGDMALGAIGGGVIGALSKTAGLSRWAISRGAGMVTMGASQTGHILNEYKINNNGEDMPLHKQALVFMAMTLLNGADLIMLFDGAGAIFKKNFLQLAKSNAFTAGEKKVLNELGKNLAKTIPAYAGGFTAEAFQEWMQSTAEVYFAQNVETAKGFLELAGLPEQQVAALIGGVMGGSLAGAGNIMASPVRTIRTVNERRKAKNDEKVRTETNRINDLATNTIENPSEAVAESILQDNIDENQKATISEYKHSLVDLMNNIVKAKNLDDLNQLRTNFNALVGILRDNKAINSEMATRINSTKANFELMEANFNRNGVDTSKIRGWLPSLDTSNKDVMTALENVAKNSNVDLKKELKNYNQVEAEVQHGSADGKRLGYISMVNNIKGINEYLKKNKDSLSKEQKDKLYKERKKYVNDLKNLYNKQLNKYNKWSQILSNANIKQEKYTYKQDKSGDNTRDEGYIYTQDLVDSDRKNPKGFMRILTATERTLDNIISLAKENNIIANTDKFSASYKNLRERIDNSISNLKKQAGKETDISSKNKKENTKQETKKEDKQQDKKAKEENKQEKQEDRNVSSKENKDTTKSQPNKAVEKRKEENNTNIPEEEKTNDKGENKEELETETKYDEKTQKYIDKINAIYDKAKSNYEKRINGIKNVPKYTLLKSTLENHSTIYLDNIRKGITDRLEQLNNPELDEETRQRLQSEVITLGNNLNGLYDESLRKKDYKIVGNLVGLIDLGKDFEKAQNTAENIIAKNTAEYIETETKEEILNSIDDEYTRALLDVLLDMTNTQVEKQYTNAIYNVHQSEESVGIILDGNNVYDLKKVVEQASFYPFRYKVDKDNNVIIQRTASGNISIDDNPAKAGDLEFATPYDKRITSKYSMLRDIQEYNKFIEKSQGGIGNVLKGFDAQQYDHNLTNKQVAELYKNIIYLTKLDKLNLDQIDFANLKDALYIKNRELQLIENIHDQFQKFLRNKYKWDEKTKQYKLKGKNDNLDYNKLKDVYLTQVNKIYGNELVENILKEYFPQEYLGKPKQLFDKLHQIKEDVDIKKEEIKELQSVLDEYMSIGIASLKDLRKEIANTKKLIETSNLNEKLNTDYTEQYLKRNINGKYNEYVARTLKYFTTKNSNTKSIFSNFEINKDNEIVQEIANDFLNTIRLTNDKEYLDNNIKDTYVYSLMLDRFPENYKKTSKAKKIDKDNGEIDIRDHLNYNFILAVDVAVAELLVNNSNLLKYDAKKTQQLPTKVEQQIADITGSAFRNQVVDRLATLVLDQLGLTVNEDLASYNDLGKIRQEIGLIAYEYARYKGYIKQTKYIIKTDDKINQYFSVANNTNEYTIQYLKAKLDFFTLGHITNTKRPSTKPIPTTQRIKNKFRWAGQKVGILQRNAVQKIRQTPHKIDFKSARWLYNNIPLVMEQLGYNADLESIENKELRDSQEGKNREIESTIINFLEMCDMYDEKTKLYFDVSVSKNNRLFYESNTINPQSNKFFRFLVIAMGNNYSEEVDFSKNINKYKFAYALGQAFGLKVNKMEGKKAFQKLFDDLTSLDPDEIETKLLNKEELKFDDLKLEVENISHFIQGINALRDYKSMVAKGDTKTNITLVLETDSATSGIFLSFMNVPLFKTLDKLAMSFGFAIGHPKYSLNRYKGSKTKLDTYEQLAVDMPQFKKLNDKQILKEYDKITEQLKKSNNAEQFSKFSKEELLEKINIFKNILPSPEANNIVSSKLRAIVKEPTMVYNYMAGLKATIKDIGSDLIHDLLEDYYKAKKVLANKKTKDDLAIIEAFDTYFNSVKVERVNGAYQEDIKNKNILELLKDYNMNQIILESGRTLRQDLIDSIAYLYVGSMFTSLKNKFGYLRGSNELLGAIYPYYANLVNKLKNDNLPINEAMKDINAEFVPSLQQNFSWDEFEGIIGLDLESRVNEDSKDSTLIPLSQDNIYVPYEIESYKNFLYSIGEDENKINRKIYGMKKNSSSSVFIRNKEYYYLAKTTAGPVTYIHTLDSNVMSQLILEEEFGMVSVHDAVVSHFMASQDNAKIYNRILGNLFNQRYNIYTSFNESIKRFKEAHIARYNRRQANFLESAEQQYYFETIEELFENEDFLNNDLADYIGNPSANYLNDDGSVNERSQAYKLKTYYFPKVTFNKSQYEDVKQFLTSQEIKNYFDSLTPFETVRETYYKFVNYQLPENVKYEDVNEFEIDFEDYVNLVLEVGNAVDYLQLELSNYDYIIHNMDSFNIDGNNSRFSSTKDEKRLLEKYDGKVKSILTKNENGILEFVADPNEINRINRELDLAREKNELEHGVYGYDEETNEIIYNFLTNTTSKEDYETLELKALQDNNARVEFLDSLIKKYPIEEKTANRLKEVLSSFENMRLDNVVLEVVKSANAIADYNLTNNKILLAVNDEGYRSQYENPAVRYVHEVVHAVTVFALDNIKELGISPEFNQLMQLYRMASQHIKPEDLIDGEVTETKLKDAQLLHDYMFNNDKDHALRGLSEFIAYGLTDERVVNKLRTLKTNKKSSVFQAIKDIFKKLLSLLFKQDKTMEEQTPHLFSLISGNRGFPSENGYASLLALAQRISKADNEAINQTQTTLDIIKSYVETTKEYSVEPINISLSKLIKKLITAGDKYFKINDEYIRITKETNKADKIVGYGKLLLKTLCMSLISSKARNALPGLFTYIGYGTPIGEAFRGYGVVGRVANEIKKDDAYSRVLQKMQLSSRQIDQRYIDTSNIYMQNFIDNVGNLSIEQQVELTNILMKTDIQSLLDLEYGKNNTDKIKHLKELLTNPEAIKREKEQLETRIKELADSDKMFNFYMNHAELTANYMTTGKANSVTRFNAKDIVRNKNKNLIEAVDKYISLLALEKTEKDSRINVSNLDDTGLEFFLLSHKNYVDSAKDIINPVNHIKGYVKPVSNSHFEYKVGYLDDSKIWGENGFKPLDNTLFTIDGKKMVIYKNGYNYKLHRNGAALLSIGQEKIGTNWFTYYQNTNDILKTKTDSKQATDKIEKDIKQYNSTQFQTISSKRMTLDELLSKTSKYENIAVINDGRETTISILQSPELKNEIGLDESAYNVLSKSIAGITRTQEAMKMNEEILEFLIEAQHQAIDQENIADNTGYRWVEFSEDSLSPFMAEAYKVQDKQVKELLKKYYKQTGKHLLVREDVALDLVGQKDIQLFNYIPRKFYKVREAVALAEQIMKYLGTMFKELIILKTPVVLIMNIVSNMMLHIAQGRNPLEVPKMYLDSWRELTAYQEDKIKYESLVQKSNIGKLTTSETNQIKMLEIKIQKNPLWELIQYGMLTNIVDDVNVNRADLENTSYVESKLIGFRSKLPNTLTKAFDMIYFTKNTQIYQIMAKGTQYSDFLARAVDFKYYMKEAKRKGLKGRELEDYKQVVFARIMDNYINYDRPHSALEQYLNDMGFLLFTKFLKRIQYVITRQAVENPVGTAVFIGTNHMFVGVDNIFESSILVKDLSNYWYNPITNTMSLLVPPILWNAGLRPDY